MKKKIPVTIICFLLIFTILPVKGVKNNTDLLSGGWLEERNGVKILHLSGSNYEMGFQHGVLLKEEVKQNIRAFLNYANNSNITYEYLLEIWNEMKDYVPQVYIDEIQGIADGAEISFLDIAVANMVITVGDMGCFGISAWKNATVDGKLYHARSFDLPFNIKDPKTGKYAHENSVIIIRKPDNGFASINPSIAGSMHGGGGVNDQKIAIGQQVCWSKDYTLHGTPGQFRVQMVLDHSSNISEAINILINNKDMGWNFIVSDGKIPIGYAVETTGNYFYYGTHDNPVEGITPFWNIDNVVRRTNFFIDKTTASTQRKNYDPSGFISFIKLVLRTDVFFAVWRSYKVVSEGIEKNHGLMDLNNTMTMIRDCYSGKTDLLLKLIVTLAKGTSFNRAWNMWVADPENGDMVVCFASRNKIAFENNVYYFNFYELLNADPP
ncbi:MAG: C45 family autoproteolytic acyltransferase/hydrolase [Candidatus Thermoplasmatota archaeon]|jgi:hypothetical protein|nr:C45 family autoproteolytic acyltransferase/hydrolase [Candidatus Thermoplasmatota archaeon]